MICLTALVSAWSSFILHNRCGVIRLASGLVASVLVSRLVRRPTTQAQIDQIRTKSLAFLITYQKGDGSWRNVSEALHR